MWWDIKQQTILSINLHVLICALNYAPVDISALFLSYSAGWSHCLLLDLLWQFQKWTPFGVQHRHSPKKKAMGVKRHSVKARIYRATLLAILLATYFGQWLQTAAFRDICRLGGNQAYDGWNIFSGFVSIYQCYYPLLPGLFSDNLQYRLANFCQSAYGALSLPVHVMKLMMPP